MSGAPGSGALPRTGIGVDVHPVGTDGQLALAEKTNEDKAEALLDEILGN